MNGFRQQLSNDISDLRDLVESVIKMEFYDTEELVDAMNRVITHSNVVNCVYSNDDPDFSDMNELEIEHLEIDDNFHD